MKSLIITSIEQGLIFAVLAIGVLLTYKILDIADLSVEGTFPLGAFVFAKFIFMGINPIISTLLAFIAGSLGGLLTAILFTKLRIKPLLSGILTMTILHSVNLRINGKSNIPLFSYDSIFDLANSLLILIIIVLFLKIIMDSFLKTETGYLLIATGDNETLVKSLGQSSNKYKIIGLMLSNGLIALSGALMAQIQGFADITMGSSIIVAALASIIIGDTIIKSSDKLKHTTRAITGAIIYKIIWGIAIEYGLQPGDLKAVSAIIVIGFLSYNNFFGDVINLTKRKDGKKDARNKKSIKEF